MAPRRRGYDASGGRPVNEKDTTEYKGQVGRSTEANHRVDSTNQYSNTYNWSNSRGDSRQIGLATDNPKESGHYESQTWAGWMEQENPRGDRFSGTTGCSVSSTKKGEIGSVNGPSDTAKHNAVRQIIGNLDGQQDLARGGGFYSENSGNRSEGDAGMKTTWTARASGYGEYHVGKKTINAEGGVGIGVNQSSNKQVWTRWEPDGTFHIQVKPEGNEGGIAVVKINPDGSILIDTKSTITMKAAKSITIDTPTLNIKANIKQNGNFKQNGHHVDSSGPHCCG